MYNTLLQIFAFLLLLFFYTKCNKSLKEHSKTWYTITAIYAVIVGALMLYNALFYETIPEGFFDHWYFAPYALSAGGLIGSMIWAAVMLSSVMPSKKIRARMMSLRTEISILGFMVSMPQSVVFTFQAYLGILNGIGGLVYAGITSVYLALLLILGITSFPSVKAKMGMKKWKKLHKLSYTFYVILFLQLTLVSVLRGVGSFGLGNYVDFAFSLLRTLFYLIVLIGWVVLKAKKKAEKKKKAVSIA